MDGGPFTPWLKASAITTADYAGADGHQYGFYSVATDNVGHRQPTPSDAQTTTTVHVVATAGTVTSVETSAVNPVYGDAVSFTATVQPSADPACPRPRAPSSSPSTVRRGARW